MENAENRGTLPLCLSNVAPDCSSCTDITLTLRNRQTLYITSAWYLLPSISYLFQLIPVTECRCSAPKSNPKDMSHHNGPVEHTRLSSSLPLNRDECIHREKMNKWLMKVATTSDVSIQWVGGLPFQAGNGYCLGEREGGLAGHIQHTD